MAFVTDIVLLSLLIVVAFAVARTRDLFVAIMLFAIYSLLCAALFTALDAPDVAITEAAVGAGMSTVLMLVTLSLVGRKGRRRPRRPMVATLIVVMTAALLIYGVSDAPRFADPSAPAHIHVAPYYLQETPRQIGIPNVVTAVLASFRGFDTLGEVMVVLAAGVGVLSLLSHGRREPVADAQRPNHVVLRVVSKLLFPVILMFALYVQAHGEISPGGGFSAGIVFATGVVLYALVFGAARVRQAIPTSWLNAGMVLGVVLFAGVGVVTMCMGGQFLEYGVLGSTQVGGQHLGIVIIELGVGITVAAVMISVYLAFAEFEPEDAVR